MNLSTCRLIGVAAGFAAAGPAGPQAPGSPVTRDLPQFLNADGRAPEGRDNDIDDAAAMRSALAAGPGVIRIGPGHYRPGDVTVPAHVTVPGCGPATVIRSNGAAHIFARRGQRDWRIRDLTLDGDAAGPWRERVDSGRAGIHCEACTAFEMTGIDVRNFAGTGIQRKASELRTRGRRT